jgi:hypothetical protein
LAPQNGARGRALRRNGAARTAARRWLVPCMTVDQRDDESADPIAAIAIQLSHTRRIRMLRTRALMLSFMLAAATGCGNADGSLDSSEQVAPIQSAEELSAYLDSTSESPLNRLSEPARERFIDSLVFSDNGLGSYRFDDLEAELSATQVYQVLSLFGVEYTTPLLQGARVSTEVDKAIMSVRRLPGTGGDLTLAEDHKGYKCSGPGSCYTDLNSICTSNC